MAEFTRWRSDDNPTTINMTHDTNWVMLMFMKLGGHGVAGRGCRLSLDGALVLGCWLQVAHETRHDSRNTSDLGDAREFSELESMSHD